MYIFDMVMMGLLVIEIYIYILSGIIICNGSGLKIEGLIFIKLELYLCYFYLLW